MYIAIASWVDLFHIGEEQTDNFYCNEGCDNFYWKIGVFWYLSL